MSRRRSHSHRTPLDIDDDSDPTSSPRSRGPSSRHFGSYIPTGSSPSHSHSHSRRTGSSFSDLSQSHTPPQSQSLNLSRHKRTRRHHHHHHHRHSHQRESGRETHQRPTTIPNPPTTTTPTPQVRPLAIKKPLHWKRQYSPFVSRSSSSVSPKGSGSGHSGLEEDDDDFFGDSLLADFGLSDADAADLLGLVEESDEVFANAKKKKSEESEGSEESETGNGPGGPRLRQQLEPGPIAVEEEEEEEDSESSSSSSLGVTSHPLYISLKSAYDALKEVPSSPSSASSSSSSLQVSILKGQIRTLRKEKAELARVIDEVRQGGIGLEEVQLLRRKMDLLEREKDERDQSIQQLKLTLEKEQGERVDLAQEKESSEALEEALAETRSQGERELQKLRNQIDELKTAKETSQLALNEAMEETRSQGEQEVEELRNRIVQLKKAHMAQIQTVATKLRDAMREKISQMNENCVKKLKLVASKNVELSRQLDEAKKSGDDLDEVQLRHRVQLEEQGESLRAEMEARLEEAHTKSKKLKNLLEEERSKAVAERLSMQTSNSAVLDAQKQSLEQEFDQKLRDLRESNSDALQKALDEKERIGHALRQLKSAASASTETVETLRSQLKESQTALSRERYVFEEFRTKSDGEVEQLRSDGSRMTEKISELQESLQKRTDELSSIRSQFTAYKARATDAVSTLQDQLRLLKSAVLQRDSQISTLKTRLHDSMGLLQNGVASLSNQIRGVGVSRFRQAVVSQLATMRKSVLSQSKELAVPLLRRISLLKEKYVNESKLRRKIFNELQDLRGQIRVFVRVRPILSIDRSHGSCIECVPELPNLFVRDIRKMDRVQFEFDFVFNPETTQAPIFEEVGPLSTSVLDGYNVCIFAYGQTGSGKTYTMEGPEDLSDESLKGVNFRAVTELFSVIADRREEVDYSVQVSIIEIYKNRVYDLLGGDRRIERQLRIGGSSVEVVDVTQVYVSDLGEMISQLKRAKVIRATASTRVNLHSSRSHCVVSLMAVGRNRLNGVEVYGKLHLIDLAGSERLKKTQLEDPDRVAEAVSINKSLTCLGMVMHALAKKSGHIPFRNSALTSYLKDSLGGQSKVLMFCCLNPSEESCDETLNSLVFARRIRKIELGRAERNIRHTRN